MPGRDKSQIGKLDCLFNYFDRVTTKMPTGNVTFQRQVCHDFPQWAESKKLFTKLHVTRDGSIEDDGHGMLQVDFANKFVGGGVIGRGCVQEEIRFTICPELIVSRLFTEELEYNETLIITGAERYSNYDGYGNTFEYTGNHEDKTPRDSFGRILTHILAMDAKKYQSHWQQFEPRCIDRELKKAYCGFHSPYTPELITLPAIATGNWGCGAFNGDRHLKALIQLMAAAEARRDVLYITIDDNKLVQEMHRVHSFFMAHFLTVGDVFNLISSYSKIMGRTNQSSLFEFIIRTYDCKPVSRLQAGTQETRSTEF
jgi:poly(ADP-ribose) glycohydrolase